MDSIFAPDAPSVQPFDDVTAMISAEIDGFEGYTHPHGKRLAILADAIAERFNFASHDRFSLRQAALLHDLGELIMERDYISSDRVLRDEERIDMQRHTVIGEQEAARRGQARAVQLLIRWHHEWWNGTGYPDALERDQIPLAARILRVVDTYCAMTDSRPYSLAISAGEAMRYLIEWSGIEFDPKVVSVFLSIGDLPELKSFAPEEPAEI